MTATNTLVSEITQLEQVLNEFKTLTSNAAKDGSKFDNSYVVSAPDISIRDLVIRTDLIVAEARVLSDVGVACASPQQLTAVSNGIKNVGQQIASVNTVIKGAEVTSFDTAGGHLLRDSGQVAYTPNLTNWLANSDGALNALKSALLNPSKSAVLRIGKTIGSVRESANRLDKRATEAENKLKAIARDERESSKRNAAIKLLEESVQGFHADAKSQSEEASRQRDSATNSAEAIASLLSAANDEKAEISSIHKDASTLLKNSEDDLAAVRAGNQSVEEALSKLKDQQNEIDRLAEQASAMLSSSTVAGLAAVFDALRGSTNTEMIEADKNVRNGIIFLVVSALPLAAFVLSPIFVLFGWASEQDLSRLLPGNGWQYLGQVGSRFVLILPAALYTAFQIRKYNQLFRLREHYAHKYALAFSVEGFKRQAPDHESMIAASVFDQLSFNPTERTGDRSADNFYNLERLLPSMNDLIDKIKSLGPKN